MVYRDADHAVYLYGGYLEDGMAGDALWRYAGGEWEAVCDPCPPGRRVAHGLAYDAARDRIILVGGVAADPASSTPLDDTWAYTDAGWAELSPTTRPPAVFGAHVAYDPNRDVVVMLGGDDGTDSLDETWELSGDEWQRSAATFPYGVDDDGQSTFFNPVRGEVGFYGGWG